MRFEEFTAHLNDAAPEDIPHVAVQLLMHMEDWCSMVREQMQCLSNREFTELVLRAHIAHVEPRIFMIAESPGRYQIILHHFDRPAFDHHLKAGRLGPHYHHFPFTTRILRGKYYNWIFDNEGGLDSPHLKLAAQVSCEAGDIYTLPYDRFHCVLLPEHDTLSLMVRGRAILDPGHPPDPNYNERVILDSRERLLQLLDDSPRPSPGRFVDLDAVPRLGEYEDSEAAPV